MYQTIRVASCVSVQGEFVEDLADGQVLVRVGETEYRGRPVSLLPLGRLVRPVVSAARQLESSPPTLL